MNCILLVIDALNNTRIQNSKNKLMPFVSSLAAQKGITCNNVFSQAPYTEAAVMALYGGQNTLDNHGYLKRYKDIPEVIFETFAQNGYSVFFNALQPQCYPSSLRRGITDLYYDRGFDSSVLWRYRLAHYAKYFKTNELTKYDYGIITEILDDNFTDWERFLDDMITDDRSVELLAPYNTEYEPVSVRKLVSEQHDEYYQNKTRYINEVLNTGESHKLFQIPYFSQIGKKTHEDVMETLQTECKKLCERVRRENIVTNLLHNPDVYGQSAHSLTEFFKTHDKKSFLESMYLVKNAISPVHMKERYGEKCKSLKGQPSFRALIDHFISWLDTDKDKNKPFFACLHVDDAHFPETFLTYDTDSKTVLDNDIAAANQYLDQRDKKDPGTITHDLSILYADAQCEYLYKQCEERGLVENTIFVVTADHGFSYSGQPIRQKAINTFFLENFKIPLWIFGPDIPKTRIDGLLSSTDIPSTICSLLGIKIPESFVGKPVQNQIHDHLFIEYCGGGCPDLLRRELLLAVFDENNMMAIRAPLSKNITIDDVSELYDLKNDPHQRTNIRNMRNDKQYDEYFTALCNRFDELKRHETQ